MIKQIKIRNVQGHHRSTLKLHPGVNVIVGTSDVGKSAIIRALKWIVFNRRTTKGFRSNWGGKTAVTIRLPKNTVRRIEDKRDRCYKLDGTTFKAVGTHLPEEIVHALNLNPINIQGQFDRPFLLDSSPGEVTLHFNRIAHLDKIDVAVKRIQMWIKTLERQLFYDRGQLKENRDVLKLFGNLDELDGQLTAVEQQEQLRINELASAKRIRQLISNIEDIDIAAKQYDRLLKIKPDVDKALELCDEAKVKRLELATLQSLVGKLLYIKKSEITLANRIERYQKRFDKRFPKVCPLCGQRRP